MSLTSLTCAMLFVLSSSVRSCRYLRKSTCQVWPLGGARKLRQTLRCCRYEVYHDAGASVCSNQRNHESATGNNDVCKRYTYATYATSTGSTRLKFMQCQTTSDLPALAMMPCPLPRKSRRTNLWSPRMNRTSINFTASKTLSTSLESITTSPSSWPLRLQISFIRNGRNIHWEAYGPENLRSPQ
jgi:hypothetical protein